MMIFTESIEADISIIYKRHRLRIRRKRIRSLGSTSTTGGSCDYMINRFPDRDTYFMEINHVLLASKGYEYDGFLHFLNSIVFISLNDNL